MKKCLAIALTLMFLLGLTTPAMTEEQPLIAVLAPAETHGWVAATSYFASQECENLGLNYKVLTSNNGAEMMSQFEEMIQQKAAAIIVFPQWTGMETAVQMALDAGIPVINFDIKIDVPGTYLLSGDNEGMGVEGAKYIAEKLEGKGKVVVLDVPTSGSVAELRKKGFLDTIAEIAPEIKIIATYATQFTREDGLKDMADILVANPQIDAVFSMDDETSIGALQAIAEAGRTDIKAITGGGGCQDYFNIMLENEDIAICSALYSPAMIKNCVTMALDIINGGTPEAVTVIPTTIVDRTNAADYLDASSPY